jgi:hypothetical protein
MELSPAPVAKKIADRSEGGSDLDSSIDIIENIDAIKSATDLEEDKKKKAVDDPNSSDSSASTITQEQVQEESSEVDGGLIQFQKDSKVGVS